MMKGSVCITTGQDFTPVSLWLDAELGRFLAVDPKAHKFPGWSPYAGMANNPISTLDPDGEEPITLTAVLIGAAIYGSVNLAGEAVRGNVDNFGDGAAAFGLGAVSGALAVVTGGSSLTYSQIALQAVLAQVPGPTVDLGGGFSVNLSPALMMGTQGYSLGANAGIGYSNGDFSVGISTGASFGKSNITGVKGWRGILGGGIAYDNGSFYGSLSTTQYYSGETSQRTGTIGLGGGGVKVHYENDFHVAGLTNYGKISDGGDRFRSAALQASYKGYSAGFNLFTGDPGPEGYRPSENGVYVPKNGSDPDKYRLGGLYIGYRDIRFGRNSEKIRHAIQNRFAHDFMTGGNAKWFKVLDHSPGWYGNIGPRNPFSLW